MRDQGLIGRAARTAASLVLVAASALAVVASTGGRAGAAPVADPAVAAAAQALHSSYVYVHPAAQARLTDAERQLLANQIAAARTPIWLAVLPTSVLASYGGSGQAAVAALAAATGQDGTYGVVIGPTAFFAVNNTGHAVGPIAAKAVRDNHAVFDVLGSFVTGVSDAFGAGAVTGAGGRAANSGAVLSLLVLVAAGGGALLISSRRSRRRDALRAAQAAAAEAAAGSEEPPSADEPSATKETERRGEEPVLGDEPSATKETATGAEGTDA